MTIVALFLDFSFSVTLLQEFQVYLSRSSLVKNKTKNTSNQGQKKDVVHVYCTDNQRNLWRNIVLVLHCL